MKGNTMSGSKHHMGQSVRGALNWSPAETRRALKFMKKDDGSRFSCSAELRDAFMDELAEGHELIPLGECDNWDWKTGCKGHPLSESEERSAG